jgi:hypothetical protein
MPKGICCFKSQNVSLKYAALQSERVAVVQNRFVHNALPYFPKQQISHAGNCRMAAQLVACRVVLGSTELVS